MKGWVLLQRYQTRIEAELLKGFLQSEGIDATITADDLGGAYPFPLAPTSKGVEIFVGEQDYKKATKFLQGLDK